MNIDYWNPLPEDIQKICNEIVDEIYAGQYSTVIAQTTQKYVERATSEGVKFAIWPDDLKQAAKKAVQPAQVDKWKETVAKPAGIDGEQMQKLVRSEEHTSELQSLMHST